jgi:CBS domain-containing protein
MNFKPNLMSKEEINASLPKYESIVKYMVKRKDLITFSPNDDINKIIDIIIDKKISGAPVLDEGGKLVGIISEKDCLRIIVDQAYHNLPYNSPKVSDYMTKNVKTLSPDSDVVEAATLFLDSPVRRILRAAKNINPAQWH